MKSSILLILIFLSLSIGHLEVQSATQFVVRIEKNSCITIKGTSNVNTFVFEQNGSVINNQMNVNFIDDECHDILNPIFIPIEIKKFDCDNVLMKRDFFNTLNADMHPYLIITISKIKLQNNASKSVNSIVNGNVDVSIKLAGVSCDYNIPFIVMLKKNKLMIVGEKKIMFSDFKLTPPSKLFGAIQVNNELLVSVNLMVKYSQM